MSTVWIVDDDRGVRVVLSAAMRDAGLTPREFSDAESAIDALAGETPAVIFTDVRMPGSSGLELLGRLAGTAAFPIIVMSAFTDVATTAAAFTWKFGSNDVTTAGDVDVQFTAAFVLGNIVSAPSRWKVFEAITP